MVEFECSEDGGHAERAVGVANAAGVEVSCGNNVEDEKYAIDGRR